MQDEYLTPPMRRISRATIGLAWVGIAALIAVWGALVAVPGALEYAVADLPGGAVPEVLSGGVRWAVVALAGVSLAPGVFGLWHVQAMFRRFLAGDILTATTARHLRLIGVASVIAALLGGAVRTAAGLVISMAAPGPGGSVAISLGSDGFVALLFGAMLIVLGAVMGDAARIADENRQIV